MAQVYQADFQPGNYSNGFWWTGLQFQFLGESEIKMEPQFDDM